MKLRDQKIEEFLENLGSKKPAPGGGSSSALAGALAGALVVKIASLTVGKEKYKKVEKRFEEMIKEAGELQKELLGLVDEDTQAYLQVVKSKGSQEAIKKAAGVPLETAQKSLEVLRMASYAAAHGNQNLRSDAHCAIELATAAIYGALENVRVNLPLIKDQRLVGEIKDVVDEVLNGTNKLVKP